MKCLVTGSEGFIGKNLVARLEKDGHEVTGFDVKEGPFSEAGETWDLMEDGHEGNVIFHLACINQMQATHLPAKNLHTNALETKELAEYAAKIGAKFIYTSTASVYGNAEQIPTPSSAREAPITDYAVAKLAGEHFVRNSGADWTILRLSNVYGPHQTLENPYCGVVGRFLEQAKARELMTIIGDGMQTRDFTFVDDVTDYLLDFCHPTIPYANKVYNVSRGVETSVYDVARTICALTGSPWLKDAEKRPIDGVSRRCLIPDLKCHTSLTRGVHLIWKWLNDSN